MAPVRERILVAAITLLASGGMRGLTHRGVDDAAGVPRGSTSNYFRTRDALLEGVVGQLLEIDRAAMDGARTIGLPSTVDALGELVAAQLEHALTANRAATVARYAVVADPCLGAATRRRLTEARGTLRTWLADVLRHLGAADPEPTARLLLAGMDGLILHAVSEPADHPDADPAPLARRLVHRTVTPT